MQRPTFLIVIAALFALAALYLWTIAAILLISPGAISLMAGKHFLFGLQLAGRYMMLLGGSVYAMVAWGLFRLQNWARWIAMLVMVISMACSSRRSRWQSSAFQSSGTDCRLRCALRLDGISHRLPR